MALRNRVKVEERRTLGQKAPRASRKLWAMAPRDFQPRVEEGRVPRDIQVRVGQEGLPGQRLQGRVETLGNGSKRYPS